MSLLLQQNRKKTQLILMYPLNECIDYYKSLRSKSNSFWLSPFPPHPYEQTLFSLTLFLPSLTVPGGKEDEEMKHMHR